MDAWINPATGDYALAAGGVSRDPAGGLANAVYLRLMTPLGTYWADPAMGSRLHELQRQKDLGRVAVLAKQYAEQALASILVDGRASAIDVSTESQPNRLALLIVVTAASGERLVFNHPVKVL